MNPDAQGLLISSRGLATLMSFREGEACLFFLKAVPPPLLFRKASGLPQRPPDHELLAAHNLSASTELHNHTRQLLVGLRCTPFGDVLRICHVGLYLTGFYGSTCTCKQAETFKSNEDCLLRETASIGSVLQAGCVIALGPVWHSTDHHMPSTHV